MAMMRRARVLWQRLGGLVRSIRFRLSLWFVMVLAVILVGFSAFVYYRQGINMREQAVARVSLRMRDLDSNFRRSMREDESGGWLQVPGTAPDSRFVLQTHEVVILADPAGVPARAWGPVSEEEAMELSALAPDRAGGKIFTAFIQGEASASATASGEKRATRSQEYLFITAPVGYEDRLLGWVILGQPIDPYGQLPRLLLTLALAGGVTLGVTLLGGYWLADRALKPVQAITRTARQINDTDLSRRLNIRTGDELGELAGTFDTMLDRLEAAFNRQRRFTADASHELRTPLTIIGLEASRALEPGRSLADIRRSLQIIQSENDFMARLVNELLTLARLEAGQIQLKHVPFDLSDLALEVVERYAPLAQSKGIRLEVGSLPEITVCGDRHYLGIALGNLLDNAIKYSPSGPGQWVRVETGASEGRAWARISDNGPGIAPEHLPHIFERFFRADPARSHNPDPLAPSGETPGSGLGLAIVQWVMTMHSGQVTVQSELGQGSAFEVSLPSSES